MRKSFITYIAIISVGFSLNASIYSSAGKWVTKKFAKEAIDESVESSIKYAARTIGREGAEKVYREFGQEALEFVAKHGDDGVKFVNRFGKSGVRIAMREGSERIVRLAGRYGDDVIRVAEKHPGTGLKIMEELGEEGVRIGRVCSTETVNRTLRYLPEMTEKGLRDKYVRTVAAQGGRFFKKAGSFAMNHTGKTFALGAGIYYLLDKDGFKENTGTLIRDASTVAGEALGGGAKVAGKGLKEFALSLAPAGVWIAIILGLGLALIHWFWKTLNAMAASVGSLFRFFRKKNKKDTLNKGE